MYKIVLLVIVFSNVLYAQPYAYITNQGENSLSVINTHTNKVVKTINVGNRPAGVVVSNNGKRVYITNPESKDISVIDTEKLLNIKTIKVGTSPLAIAISPDDQTIYVADWYDDAIFIIDTVSLKIANKIQIESPLGLSQVDTN